MKTITKQSLVLIVLLLIFTTVFGQSNNFEISKNLDIYATLFKELNTNYVDDIKPGELMKTGIDAMLESLDPYTVYIPEAEVEDYKFIATGQYGGIGALIHKQGDYVVISEPYEGNPAQKQGLKAGDKILEIDGVSAKGKSTSDVSSILKGQPGTKVKLLIERESEDHPIEKDLERENVKIDNIPYFTMVADGIGYIKLTGFTQNAGKEVKEAFLDLKGKNNLHGIILDLRGNGGGLLQEAVNISNIFVDKGQNIVSTKGKLPNKNNTYRTLEPAVDKDISLVVLVDNSSASASEIVAGAIQDLDRGIVIGQRTFGKGLVQNVIPLSYNAQAKITVAKYYIPSGRCIQAIDYSHKDENGVAERVPDSLIMTFNTKNGRSVHDGLGIEPDVQVEPEKLSNISYSLLTKYLIFDFANKYAREHPEIAPPDQFTISEDIFNNFVGYISDKDYEYTTKCEETLEKLKKYAEAEEYFEDIQGEYEQLAAKLREIKEGDIERHEEEIKDILKLEIVSRYYYQKGKIIASLASDKDLDKAIEILNEKNTYLAILDGSFKQDKEN
ncbi:MAG: PDZ domain-containing protein [Bacteroidales bacterium]|nr:PDZ domain-containing protein [Bacteroidales bacterium]